ncbi:MAG: phosphatidylserine decarboxylase [Cellvibrionaceae bacterium]|nr:phosphatidylserine decarboxylase [Cellvibrionaceae bacterium]
MKNFLFIFCQYLIPQHLLSRLIGKLADAKTVWFKDRLIAWFIQHYQVDMQQAAEPDPTSYSNFNDFFTRALACDQRPIAADHHAIISPADGCISQIGRIQQGRIFQAKGQQYSLLELLGGQRQWAQHLHDGHFATIYLSPRDYHRVHMPFDGTLERMIHIPGDLFSVNSVTASHVPRLFARNERLVCLFTTQQGPMAVILVGAMIVASIETAWAGLVTPVKRQIRQWEYGHKQVIHLQKGDELGRFKLGSTAIVLTGPNMVQWQTTLMADSPIKMGEAIGVVKP